MKEIFTVCILCFIISGCSKTKDRVINDIFPNKITLTPKFYEVDEILRPVDMVILDDYLIIQNDIMPNQDCFFVYTLDSLHFLYSFARNGHGPEEFIAPALIQNDKENFLSVFDQASFKLIKYRLSSDSVSIVGKNKILVGDKRPWQEIYYRNDSILIFSTLDNEIQTYDIKKHAILDRFYFTSNLKDLMSNKYNKSFENFHFSYSDEQIVVGFNFKNKLVWGTVDEEGKITMEEEKLNFEYELNKSLFDNRYYYMYTTLNPIFLFAQYVGYNFRDLQPFPLNTGGRKFDMLLEIYDRNQKPIALLDLQHDILRCKIDERNSKIYTWNMLEDFNHLIVYDYSEIKK